MDYKNYDFWDFLYDIFLKQDFWSVFWDVFIILVFIKYKLIMKSKEYEDEHTE